MEIILSLAIQVFSGAVGGNIAGTLLKQYNLGVLGNTLAGIVGGGLGGQLPSIVGFGGIEGVTGDILSGGVGGAVLMVVIGLIRKGVSS